MPAALTHADVVRRLIDAEAEAQRLTAEAQERVRLRIERAQAEADALVRDAVQRAQADGKAALEAALAKAEDESRAEIEGARTRADAAEARAAKAFDEAVDLIVRRVTQGET